jgi:hypothetical protein
MISLEHTIFNEINLTKWYDFYTSPTQRNRKRKRDAVSQMIVHFKNGYKYKHETN